MEEGQFCSLLAQIEGVYILVDDRDLRIWSRSMDGSFSVATCFFAFNSDVSDFCSIAQLWKFKAPPRVLAFSWVALLGGTLTIDNL